MTRKFAVAGGLALARPSAFRFVQYDKLGTGLSDPSDGRAGIDGRLEELAAILDATAVERTWLGGFSEGG
jgi:pimeloyl-ACP methyl ester carboxylesterase